MHTKILTVGLLILSFLGIADSTYLSYTALTNTALTCNIKGLDGCNTVAQSVYSHLFGIPLALYGVVFYVLVFIFAAAALFWTRRFLTAGLATLGTLGLIASIIFELIQVVLIKAICIYCLGSAIISLFLCILGLLVWRWTNRNTSIPPAVSVQAPAATPDEKATL
jgi:uncharacterized membrane protein